MSVENIVGDKYIVSSRYCRLSNLSAVWVVQVLIKLKSDTEKFCDMWFEGKITDDLDERMKGLDMGNPMSFLAFNIPRTFQTVEEVRLSAYKELLEEYSKKSFDEMFNKIIN